MKRLWFVTVATVAVASGCGYLGAWRHGGCWRTFNDGYVVNGCTSGMCGESVYGDTVYDDGVFDAGVYDDGHYPVYMPGDATVIGPQIVAPGETIPAPPGEPLPEPAQR